MKSTLRNILLSGIACLSMVSAPMLHADDAKTAPNPEDSGKARAYGFSGIVGTVDNVGKSVGLKKKEGERVLKIDKDSALFVDGKPAILSDVKTGYYAHGSAHKENGQEYVVKAKFEKEAPAPKDKKKVESAAPSPAPAAIAPSASTNAAPDAAAPPVKKKKKKNTSTNAPPAVN